MDIGTYLLLLLISIVSLLVLGVISARSRRRLRVRTFGYAVTVVAAALAGLLLGSFGWLFNLIVLVLVSALLVLGVVLAQCRGTLGFRLLGYAAILMGIALTAMLTFNLWVLLDTAD